MQFIGKSGIAVFVLLVFGAVGVGFGSGLLVGREFPAHRYERFGETLYLFDPTTGKVCNPFKDPKAPVDLSGIWNSSQAPPRDANGFQIVKPAPNYPPPCGK
jgi:hypothetical protein